MKKLSVALKSESFHSNYDNYEKRLYFSVSEIVFVLSYSYPKFYTDGEPN